MGTVNRILITSRGASLSDSCTSDRCCFFRMGNCPVLMHWLYLLVKKKLGIFSRIKSDLLTFIFPCDFLASVYAL